MRGYIAMVIALVVLGGFVLSYVFVISACESSPVRIMIGSDILNVDIADTPTEQVEGLSGRSSLPFDHGMLFTFDHPGRWGFWMKGMMFPLDIIWLDSSKKAIFIEQNLPPCSPSECPAFTPNSDAMYVLEVNAGFVQSHHIGLGEGFNFLPSSFNSGFCGNR